LRRLAGLADRVLHLAPPASDASPAWWRDLRTQALLRALRLRSAPWALVYASTSGVYGDCGGERVSEARTVRPHTPRAQRRVDAERQVRFFGRGNGVRANILRIPGIYAADRAGGTPRERLKKGTPVLRPEDDVYTNHVHADDLARMLVAALWRGTPQRIYNASDDSALQMGEYFDLAADLFGLPRPPRVPRSTAQEQLPLMLLSFMGESRRLDNARIKRELRVRLRYPHVRDGLQVAVGPIAPPP
jgi:nucleoside-diphosphate-sugar epimerase